MNKSEYIDNLLKEAREQSRDTFKNKQLRTTDIINKLVNALEGVQEELENVNGLLSVAQCPDCDGSGILVTIVEGCEAGCCGNPSIMGECCGDPIPVQTQEQQLEPCQWCCEVEAFHNNIGWNNEKS